MRTTRAFTGELGRLAAKSTPTVEMRRGVSPSAARDEVSATDPMAEIASLSAAAASNSTGGMSPSASCSRVWLYQPTDSTVASSSCARVRQIRSAISSVLYQSTRDSGIALS